MKNKIYLLSFIPFLISCHAYHGIKYELPYDENASLKEITPKEMLNIGAKNKVDSVYLIAGLKDCSACLNASEEVNRYINKNHVTIYFLNMSNITFSSEYKNIDEGYPDTDYFYVYYATTYLNGGVGDANSLPHPSNIKELIVPSLLFFKYGGVGSNVNTDFYNYLNKYIKVV